MSFTYSRTIYFRDTDAAGVVYFANLLSICHEAYEASLAAAEVNLRSFFRPGAIAVPIVHVEADFHRPLFCGDRCLVQVNPTLLTASKFEIQYQIQAAEPPHLLLGRAHTLHLCIQLSDRQQHPLPAALQTWLMQLSDRP